MTLEEAKKILKKEGYFLVKVSKGFEFSELPVWEKPEVVEAKRVVNENGFATAMNTSEWIDRQERLKKEYEKDTKAPGPGEEQPKEGNPALAESASQFNDALLDEQAKKIAELTKEKSNLEDQITVLNACKKHNDKIDRKQIKCLGKEIARLNGIIHKKNMKIEELRKESSRHLRGKTKMFGENVDLEQMLKDKNAVLADVAEELRLTKIREKNLTEVGQKYMKENEELKEELEKMTKLVETVRKGSKEYCDYGIAAEKMIQKMAKEIVNDSPVPSKDYKQYRLWANGYRFNPQLPDFSEEEEKKLEHAKKIRVSSDIAEEGKDHSGVIVLCGKDFVKKFKENEESLSEFLKNIEDEAVESMSIESGHLGGNESFGQMEALKPSQRFKQAVCDARLELLYFIS